MKPPRRPADWYPPGEFILTKYQQADSTFVAVAHLAWKQHRGYLIDWLWCIFDEARNEAQREKWEHENGRKE